jgi:hypothetical protein
MSAPNLVLEEPVRPNMTITALDEASQRLTLADFSLTSVCRYSFVWARGDRGFQNASASLLVSLAKIRPKAMQLVVGWRHEVRGPFRMRHAQLRAYLVKSGWHVHLEDQLGIGVLNLAPSHLHQTVASVEARDVGWFAALGGWATPEQLSVPPFRRTVDFFCWNHQLAPSKEFLNALPPYSGDIAYRSVGDDRLPTVVLVTSEPMGDAIVKQIELGNVDPKPA